MNQEIIDFYQTSYNNLGKQTRKLLEDPEFMKSIETLAEKWHVGHDWQKAILDDYIERIDHDIRIKTNEESCFEIEENLNLSSELRLHHGLDRSLVDLYIRQELFKESETGKAISTIDPRNHWETFSRELKQTCQHFDLEPADAMFIYRNVLGLPLINLVKESIMPNIESSYDPPAGINTIKIELSDDALRYCSEETLECIKEAVRELKKNRELTESSPTAGKQDITWYYKTVGNGKDSKDYMFMDIPFLQYLIKKANTLFQNTF